MRGEGGLTTLCERDCTNKSKAGIEPEIATDGNDSGDDDDKMPLSMMAHETQYANGFEANRKRLRQ